MGGKKGTLLGRTLLKFIPEASQFHSVAEAVDQTFETMIFDAKQNAEVPVKESSDVKDAVNTLKPFVMALAEKGVIKIDFPGVDGPEEEQVEKGLLMVLEGYVNEFID